MKILQHKVALVTGGTSGIGKATAIAFGAAGAKVVVSGTSEAEGEHTANLIRKSGAECLFVRADIASEADVRSLIQKTVESYGRLDIAFNNAGIEGSSNPLHQLASEDLERIMALDLQRVFLCMKYESQQMQTQGSGIIINNSSVLGVFDTVDYSPYATDRHAAIGLARAAALEYAKQGI